ncbi:MAG: glycosyl hydrolase 115 family protein [Planctomycetaceae bacterium]|jgi:hypothetical protein|nr:glycosyl hydrolase 115 family protein [Planctomycetaceae bacterium]
MRFIVPATTAVLLVITAFTLADDSAAISADTPWVVSGKLSESVQRAFDDVKTDWYKVFGRNPVITGSIPADYKGGYIQLNEPANGGRESFSLTLNQDAQKRSVLNLSGADKRGTIYALYTFSEKVLNIDPWYFWTQHKPAKKTVITLPADFKVEHGSPTFKYRGWFINDEDLLSIFAADPLRENVFSLTMYDKIYETILRLKGNMIAPATFPFPDERCQELAARRGLVINMHHILVLGLNTYRYPKNVPFSHNNHPEIMEQYWQTCIDAFKDYEVVWTVGYRGKHDRPFWEDEKEIKTPQQRGEVITKAIAKQVEMIRKKHPNADIISNLWMEGADLYHKGLLKLPEGVTLVWADNGAGYIGDMQGVHPHNTVTGNETEARVQKGQGIYYHTAMLNGRANQLSELVPPSRIYHEIGRFVKADAAAFFLVNVSDIRDVPLTTDCAMKFVYDAKPYLGRTDDENQKAFLLDWSRRQFTSANAELLPESVAGLYEQYFNVPYMKNQLGDHHLHHLVGRLCGDAASSLEGKKPLTEKAVKTLDNSIQFVTANKDALTKAFNEAKILLDKIPEERKNFYRAHILFQLGLHKIMVDTLETCCGALTAYKDGNAAEGVKLLDKALSGFEELFALRSGAEAEHWSAWFRGADFVNIEAAFDRIRTMRARINGEPLPPLRRGRGGYGDIEKYQEPFLQNFPLLYPKR